MAPGSDIDLLFLLPYKQTAWSESVVEAMLYVLWDLKLEVLAGGRVVVGIEAPDHGVVDRPHHRIGEAAQALRAGEC
jgi:hypothetical protein